MKQYNVQVFKHWSSWYFNGKLHREDGPAIEYSDGSKYWFLNGKRHREDGPAIECPDGEKRWYLNDKNLTESEFIQRTKEKINTKELSESTIMKEYTVKVFENRTKWYFNGKLHRENGPAIERSNGTKEWWLIGKLHRENGPAIEYADGTKAWYLNGKELSESEFRTKESSPAIDGQQFSESTYNQSCIKISKSNYFMQTITIT